MKLLRPILASATLGAHFLGSLLVPRERRRDRAEWRTRLLHHYSGGERPGQQDPHHWGDRRLRNHPHCGHKASSLQRVSLKKGSFIVDEYALQVASQDHQPTINPFNCSFRVESGIAGTVTLSEGTGLYKHISGTLSATDTFAAIQPMKNGKCVDNGRFVANSS